MKTFLNLSQKEKSSFVEEVFNLRKQGFGYTKIIKFMKLKEGVRLSKGTLYYWFNNKVKLMGGKNFFEQKPSTELSYLLGVMFGDGCLSINAKKCEYRIRLEAIDKDFVKRFAESLSKLLGKENAYPICKTKRGMYSAESRSKDLYYFLKQIKENFSNIKIYTEEFPAEFIRGLADSEGCPGISAKRKFGVSIIVAVSTNLALLEFTYSLLKRFEINSKIRRCRKKGETDSIINNRPITRTKDLYSLTISKKKDVLKFSESIGFYIERKQKKLKEAAKLMFLPNKIALRIWKQKYKKTPKEWKPVEDCSLLGCGG